MDCPLCGKDNNDVIDSRPTKEGIAVRRRRHCLACGRRFTTYESTADNIFRVLMKTNAGGLTVTNLREVLETISRAFKGLTQETEKLISQADKLEKPEAAKEAKRKGGAKLTKKKSGARKSGGRKAVSPTATAALLGIVKRHKKGVGITKLKDRTGFESSRIKNILSRACREGKIKRVKRGVYVTV